MYRERNDGDTNDEDYESVEENSSTSDEDAKLLIRPISPRPPDLNVDQAFRDIAYNMNLSPIRFRSSREGSVVRGNTGGRTKSQAFVTRSQSNSFFSKQF